MQSMVFRMFVRQGVVALSKKHVDTETTYEILDPCSSPKLNDSHFLINENRIEWDKLIAGEEPDFSSFNLPEKLISEAVLRECWNELQQTQLASDQRIWLI
jgi:hypothetical protein